MLCTLQQNYISPPPLASFAFGCRSVPFCHPYSIIAILWRGERVKKRLRRMQCRHGTGVWAHQYTCMCVISIPSFSFRPPKSIAPTVAATATATVSTISKFYSLKLPIAIHRRQIFSFCCCRCSWWGGGGGSAPKWKQLRHRFPANLAFWYSKSNYETPKHSETICCLRRQFQLRFIQTGCDAGADSRGIVCVKF